jgi:hypothetical protein
MKYCVICGKRIYTQQKPKLKNGRWYHPACLEISPMDRFLEKKEETEK